MQGSQRQNDVYPLEYQNHRQDKGFSPQELAQVYLHIKTYPHLNLLRSVQVNWDFFLWD